MKRLFVLVICTAALVMSAHAYDYASVRERFEKISDDCANVDVLGASASCLRDKDKEYGLELERLYKRLLKDASINTAALRESQRTWLNYQKQTCKSYELKAARAAVHSTTLMSASASPS
jgi:uncharacterized protein YecT (DUF1311 family)